MYSLEAGQLSSHVVSDKANPDLQALHTSLVGPVQAEHFESHG